jgi:hypothetical protein
MTQSQMLEIKEGWIITDDPLVLQFGETNLYADLGAELMIAAQKNGKKICVEVKSWRIRLKCTKKVYKTFFRLELTQN